MTAKCEFEVETWGPHEGCAEFMDEPEVWTCRDAAEMRVTFRRVDWDEPPGRLAMCRFHAEYELSEQIPGVEVTVSPL